MTTADTLPDAQRAVLTAIRALCEREGIPPTTREIRDAIDMPNMRSVATVHAALVALEAAGYVVSTRGKARSIRLV